MLQSHGEQLEAWSRPGKRLLAIGSVVQLARQGDVVWGAGLRSASLAEEVSARVDVRALRGPLTADALRASCGIDCRVFGDPGLLAPQLLHLTKCTPRRQPGTPHLLYLSHFGDDRPAPRHFKHLRMTGDPRDIIAAIRHADIVVSSALHGIVLAEAFGVPAAWLSGLSREPDFKFLDYYYGTQRESPLRMERSNNWEDFINPPPRFSSDALLKAFPLDCFGKAPSAAHAARPA
jgi:pyruvyltransferase